jgi:hypothetical protein
VHFLPRACTSGEHWDHTEQMDTYYNPIPHFGYDLALSHSPQVRWVRHLPRYILNTSLFPTNPNTRASCPQNR